MRRIRVTPESGQRALRNHAVEKALLARQRYGDPRDVATFLRVLEDRDIVRYSTVIEFDAAAMLPGEIAHVEPLGPRAADGFRLLLHPRFRCRAGALPFLAAYHIVRINYGDAATSEEAEAFGATLLGLGIDDYYAALCELAGELDNDRDEPSETP